MFSGNILELVVYSGSQLVHSSLGKFSIRTDDFVKLPIDNHGELDVRLGG